MSFVRVKNEQYEWKNTISQCKEHIINLSYLHPKEKCYIYYEGEKIYALMKYVEIDYNGVIVFWCPNTLTTSLRDDLAKFILNKLIKKHTYFKISVQLLANQTKYITLFKSLGFTEELYLREHIKIQNKYLDVLILSIDNEREG